MCEPNWWKRYVRARLIRHASKHQYRSEKWTLARKIKMRAPFFLVVEEFFFSCTTSNLWVGFAHTNLIKHEATRQQFWRFHVKIEMFVRYTCERQEFSLCNQTKWFFVFLVSAECESAHASMQTPHTLIARRTGHVLFIACGCCKTVCWMN